VIEIGYGAGTPRSEPLVHRALLYGGEDEFLAAAVPFLRDGLEAEDTVLAVVARPNIMALRGTLGRDAKPVTFVPADDFYLHPVRTINEYNKIVVGAQPRRVWALAEPVWTGRSPLETVEWERYESVVNAAFASSGAQVICGYDTRKLEDQVVDAARQTHPIIVQGRGPYTSRHYAEPDRFATAIDTDPLPPPPPGVRVMTLEDTEDFRTLRAFVGDHAIMIGMPGDAVRLLLIAVCEVATNAVRHGAPPMEVRVWKDGGCLVTEVIDFGHWRPDPLIGHIPPEPGSGIGLWGVRLLADTVELRTGWTGTTVRLRSRL
jgi:anti-sigma regulatory factor (Ser/Thr protein kinase)